MEDMTGSGLEAVFMQQRQALLRFLRARGAGDGAEDLLHELWLRTSTRPTEPLADPLAYLYRAADNLILDRRRSEIRRERRQYDWVQIRGDRAAGMVGEALGEDTLLARAELRAALQVLASLGPRTETIFVRFRVEGVDQRTIADDLGISRSAVEKHLQKAYRALDQLRERSDAE